MTSWYFFFDFLVSVVIFPRLVNGVLSEVDRYIIVAGVQHRLLQGAVSGAQSRRVARQE